MKRYCTIVFLLLHLGVSLAQVTDISAIDNLTNRLQQQLRHKVACTEEVRSQQTDGSRIMPRSVSNDGSLRLVNKDDWCSGFYPGEMWLMYDLTGDEYWRREAVRNTWMLEQVQYHGGSHDIGFMMGCSFGKAYEATGDKRYRDILLQSAKTLTTRFNPTVGCILSWSWGGDRWRFPVIIDNMMNLELLFEATRISGDSTYQHIAVSHADKTLANHFREDHSSYHVVDYNPENGEVIKRITFQGHHDESVWSRGQAWGLYGYTVCYRYTHDPKYLQKAQQIARYFFTLPNMPADLIPYWDMKDPGIANGKGKAKDGGVPRDASAAAIFASALLELAEYSGVNDAVYFRGLAEKILESLAGNGAVNQSGYMAETSTNQGFLLLHATGNHPAGDEIDTSINYADYYFLEAMCRARKMCWRPMALTTDRSLESELAKKPATKTLPLGNMTIAMPLSTGKRAQGPANDPDYAIYGTYSGRMALDGIDAREWNRLSLDVNNDLDAGVANINIVIEGDGKAGLGAHLVDIPAGGTKHVDYELTEQEMRRITGIRIYTDLKGRNLSKRDSIHYYINNIHFSHIDTPEKTQGWLPEQNTIVYSMSGYTPTGAKTAITAYRKKCPKQFTLTDANTGNIVYKGKVRREKTTLGEFCVLDFSGFQTPGNYYLCYDGQQTPSFPISNDIFAAPTEKVLNFIRCQRCGDSVEGIHGKCHTDVYADHNGESLTYGGGWHDAGDLSQQTLQTADVAFSLLEVYDAWKDNRQAEALKIKEEALHGLKQVLRCRLGDGYHASSIGLLHWTDGLATTADDIHTVRKQNLAFDNFLYSAYEAYAAMVLGDESLKTIAKEDFHFAKEKYDREGLDTFRIEMEHTYNTSFCTFMAAASWAASMLYELTGEEVYANLAAMYADEMLQCQETAGDFAGFFYRDRSHTAAVHFIHQSREQLPMQALAALLKTQSGNASSAGWLQAVQLYGNYLKRTIAYTLPYGMIPSGVYKDREYDDADGFNHLHLWAPENAHELYDQQLAEGTKGTKDLTLRRFPVWFSIFNGNEAIMLSSGKAAAICGNVLGDETLKQIACEQLYWTTGKNPFRQSLIYGEGHRYPSLDNFSSGEIIGAMPVGIRSYGSTDQPYWPLTNNACYKEVWLTTAGKWMSVVAELCK